MRLDGLNGKRVLVTAGASGICATVAQSFVEQGARVHVSDVDESALSAFAAASPGIGVTPCDVALASDVDRLFEAALAALGGLDIMVSGAGIAGPAGNVEDIDEDGWRRTLDVNTTGAFLLSRRAAPIFKRQRAGSMVIMSSVNALFGARSRTPYVASKWALIGLVKCLAMELGPFGVRVNAICPGAVEGERFDRVLRIESEARGISQAELRAEYAISTSMRTCVTADDVAATVLFICSDAGARVSGQALAVDGHTEYML